VSDFVGLVPWDSDYTIQDVLRRVRIGDRVESDRGHRGTVTAIGYEPFAGEYVRAVCDDGPERPFFPHNLKVVTV
jgi:hypothetical protein